MITFEMCKHRGKWGFWIPIPIKPTINNVVVKISKGICVRMPKNSNAFWEWSRAELTKVTKNLTMTVVLIGQKYYETHYSDKYSYLRLPLSMQATLISIAEVLKVLRWLIISYLLSTWTLHENNAKSIWGQFDRSRANSWTSTGQYKLSRNTRRQKLSSGKCLYDLLKNKVPETKVWKTRKEL